MIREVRPQVLVTYDQFGGYGHPDHIQAHRVAMYAAQLAAVPSYRRDLGEPHDIAKIYWTAMSESRMRESLRALRESGDTETFAGMEPDGKLPPFVTADELITARVDGTATVQRKMDALAKHDTQVQTDGPFFAGAESGHAWWAEEFYRLVKGTAGPRTPTGSRRTSSPVCEGSSRPSRQRPSSGWSPVPPGRSSTSTGGGWRSPWRGAGRRSPGCRPESYAWPSPLGWCMAVLRGALERPAGGFLIGADAAGWSFLAGSLVLLVAALVTVRGGARARRGPVSSGVAHLNSRRGEEPPEH